MLDSGGIAIGEGVTPEGRGWRLRASVVRPDRIWVSLDIFGDPSHPYLRHTESGSGSVGPPMPSDAIVGCPGLGSCDGVQEVVGEVVPYAAEVRVRLDNAQELRAEIVRSAVTPNDYYVAFAPDEEEVTAAVAIDGDGRIIGEARRPEEQIRSYREFRQRRRRGLGWEHGTQPES